MSGNGLVVMDLQGGDAAYMLVDAERWQQIVEVRDAAENNTNELFEILAWLASDDGDRPAGAPDRKGKTLGTWYTQTWVIEAVNLSGVVGILTLP